MARAATLYGLGVRSDLPVAAFAGMPPPVSVDVTWTLGRMPEGFDRIPEVAWQPHGAILDDDDAPARVFHAHAHGLYRFDYADGTRVALDDRGGHVWATWREAATLEDTATYLLGPVMGFVLRLRGVPCLHASAVSVDGRAIAFAGHAGSGKSTLAAALGLRGYDVLTEDVLALRREGDRIVAAPGYPVVRLWPSSAAALCGSPEALPRITPGWDKRFLALGAGNAPFAPRALPLGAVCVLDDRGGRTPIARLEPSEAFVWLVAHAYSARLLDRRMRATEFERLGEVAAEVAVLRISPPASFSRLPAFLDELLGRAKAESLAGDHAPV